MQDALRYLRNNVIEERVRKYPDRAESDRYFNYPYDAIEEALANAVYHKGYDVREPIEVRVLPDRIELLSFPWSRPLDQRRGPKAISGGEPTVPKPTGGRVPEGAGSH